MSFFKSVRLSIKSLMMFFLYYYNLYTGENEIAIQCNWCF